MTGVFSDKVLSTIVLCTSGASFSAVVSSSTGLSKGGKSLGLTKTVVSFLGSSGGLLKPKNNKPTMAMAWTPNVNPSAIVFCLNGGRCNFFIAYFNGSVSKPTWVRPESCSADINFMTSP